jgi:hypothetical protein
MNRQKLEKLRREIESLRNSIHNVRPDDLVSLAKSLGRKKSKKGKHPTYESTLMPSRNPLSIPGHPTIKPGTARSILDELDADADGISALLDEQEKRNDTQRLPARTIRKSGDA